MKILVTGAKGFVGRNLCSQLRNIAEGKARWYDCPSDLTIFEYDIDSPKELLDDYCREADFVFNLAGVNRPKDPAEFMQGNFGFASLLLDTLKRHHNACPVMISSSIQALLDNPYGESKRAGEKLLFDYAEATGARVLVYRFPNVFGKWCRPNYNSAVATFCNNIANDLPITVNDPSVKMHLVYIDDVVDELIGALSGTTYLSYLPEEKTIYPLKMNIDQRGSFTEIIRTPDRGQVSINISKPGITKGQHWHHTKNEKFVVVSGHGLIQLRREGVDEQGNPYPVREYEVSGEHIQVVEMLPGFTHNIINLSDTDDLVTLMWANEAFNPNRPDTYFDPVI